MLGQADLTLKFFSLCRGAQAEWAEAVSEESRLLRDHQLQLEAELHAAQAAAAAAARPGSADERASASGRCRDSARAEVADEAGVIVGGAPDPGDAPQEGPEALGCEVRDLRDSLAAQSGLTQARATVAACRLSCNAALRHQPRLRHKNACRAAAEHTALASLRPSGACLTVLNRYPLKSENMRRRWQDPRHTSDKGTCMDTGHAHADLQNRNTGCVFDLPMDIETLQPQPMQELVAGLAAAQAEAAALRQCLAACEAETALLRAQLAAQAPQHTKSGAGGAHATYEALQQQVVQVRAADSTAPRVW